MFQSLEGPAITGLIKGDECTESEAFLGLTRGLVHRYGFTRKLNIIPFSVCSAIWQ